MGGNPHQIDAVIFALRRLREGGCILADEVGLGKTIEAGLVIAQSRAEGGCCSGIVRCGQLA
jgi:SNF2 family DNA or RNA helicase